MKIQSKKVSILGSPISLGTFEEQVDHILSLKKSKGSAYVCCANVHMVMEAYHDPSFKAVLADADVALPDGKPLSVTMKFLYGINQEKVSGPDIMPVLLNRAEQESKSVFFLGDTEDTLLKLSATVKEKHPNLTIAGTYSPPFRALTQEESDGLIKQINEADTDLLFVALGCPKQEKWMADHRGKIFSTMLGVGYAFRTYAGLADRAPSWMRNAGLEWLFRLFQNPGRLWKRYLITNSGYFFRVLMAMFSKRQNIQANKS